MQIIIGIDPGSRITGFGVIKYENNQYCYLDSGCINTFSASVSKSARDQIYETGKIYANPAYKSSENSLAVSSRLKIIYQGVCELIEQYQPTEMSIEQVFVNKNVQSALKLGQARGVAMLAAAMHDLPVYEYAPRKIKQAVVGSGAADKLQVQHMVKQLLQLPKVPQADAADALAVAMCHINQNQFYLQAGL